MEKTAKKAKGNLKVSGGVIVSIAQTAAAETEGVAIASSDKPAVIMNAPLFSKLVSPIRVRLTPESAAIEVSIITEMGYKAAEVAKAVQNSVKSSVQSMTGITVSKVNVKVIGIKTK